MVEIAIVEDNSIEREKILECLNYYAQSERLDYSVSVYEDGLKFLGNYRDGFDIVFMDIEMPEMNGMDTAKAMRSMGSSAILIFITHMAQYAISGYEVEALDFILKPVNKYSFAMKMKRAVARTVKNKDEFISVKTRSEMRSIRIASIKYIDMDDGYVVYHTTDGVFMEYITMRDACAKINRDSFVYCNRSYLVNLKYVSAVSKNMVTVCGEELIISRPKRKTFLAALSDYMRGKK